mgnify:CR=1 FL=1
MHLCYEWYVYDLQWSKTCVSGYQDRLVRCQDHLGQSLPDHQCHMESRPEDSQVKVVEDVSLVHTVIILFRFATPKFVILGEKINLPGKSCDGHLWVIINL